MAQSEPLYKLIRKLPIDQLAQQMLDEHWVDLYRVNLKYINVAIMKRELIAILTEIDSDLHNSFTDQCHDLHQLLETHVSLEMCKAIHDILFLPIGWFENNEDFTVSPIWENYSVDQSAAIKSYMDTLNLNPNIPGGNLPLLSKLRWTTRHCLYHDTAFLGDITLYESDLKKIPISFVTQPYSKTVTFIYTNHMDIPEEVTYNVTDIANVASVLQAIIAFYGRNIASLLTDKQKNMRIHNGTPVSSCNYVTMGIIGQFRAFNGLTTRRPGVYSV